MYRRVLVAVLVACATACSSPTGPTDGGVDRLTAVIDGQPFTATIMTATIQDISGVRFLQIMGLNGCRGDTTLSVILQPVGAIGTYTSGLSAGLNRMANGQSIGAWGSSNSGSLTITSLSQTRVAGTFTFEVLLPAGSHLPTNNRSVTNGVFDIQLAERRIC